MRTKATTPITMLEIRKIRTNGGTQTRARLRPERVQELQQVLADGDDLEPIVVYRHGSTYLPSRGLHRIEAYRQEGRTHIPAYVREGTKRDAIRDGFASNNSLERSPEDKRHSIRLAFADSEWRHLSDREIGRLCRVDHKTVALARRDLEATGEIPQMRERTVTAGDRTYTLHIPEQIQGNRSLTKAFAALPAGKQKLLIDIAEGRAKPPKEHDLPVRVATRQYRTKTCQCTVCKRKFVCDNGCG